MTRMTRLLLGSGGMSTVDRREAWIGELDRFLGPVRRILFIPHALADHDGYLQKMRERGFEAGRVLDGIHRAEDPERAIDQAQAIYVGGGNSFRLLEQLQKNGWIDRIRARVLSGVPYIGVSAGTNMACPTIKTTNDMPIVQPSTFEALGLVPFQINPHFFSGPLHFQDAGGTLIPYAGETREDRIREFHEMNETPVLGLWEGAILEVESNRARLTEAGRAKLFRRGDVSREIAPGSDLSFLLEVGSS